MLNRIDSKWVVCIHTLTLSPIHFTLALGLSVPHSTLKIRLVNAPIFSVFFVFESVRGLVCVRRIIYYLYCGWCIPAQTNDRQPYVCEHWLSRNMTNEQNSHSMRNCQNTKTSTSSECVQSECFLIQLQSGIPREMNFQLKLIPILEFCFIKTRVAFYHRQTIATFVPVSIWFRFKRPEICKRCK